MRKPKKLPSKEDILRLFDYDRSSGSLFNKKGKKLITKTTAGYNLVKINGSCYYVHRIIFFLETEEEPDYLDHIDRNPENNHISNLRAVTKGENNQNKHKEKGSSLYKGVSWSEERNKWVAQLSKNGRHVFTKRFKTEKEAAIAYNEAVKIHYGEIAFLNKIDDDI